MLDAYLQELCARLSGLLRDELLGVYAGGSYAFGAYVQGRSDIDVTAVCARSLPHAAKASIVAALRYEALRCPARGLEFVLYPAATVREPTGEPGFELNLNTGAGMDFRADTAPGDIEGFWFAIDRSILREHGVALHGPPAREMFAAIPRDVLIPLLEESLRWHRESDEPLESDARLNTLRTQLFIDEGVWISKAEAARRA